MDKIIEIDENGKVHHPDAAPPKELRGVFDPGSASDDLPVLPLDAAPVAWRIRSLEPGAVGTWFYRDERPHQLTMEDSRGEVQPLYAHPEDVLKKTPRNLHSGEAIKANLHSEDAPNSGTTVPNEGT